MGLCHGWLSPFLMICTECVNKSKLVAIPNDVHLKTLACWLAFPQPVKNHPQNNWPNDLQLWSHHLTKYFILSCVIFFPLPRSSAVSQRSVYNCFLHVLNLSFDDLFLTHGINLSVKFTELCEAAKDPPIAFLFDRRKDLWEERKKNLGFWSQTI